VIFTIEAVTGNHNTINVVTLDEKWLYPETHNGGAMKPGRFLLVFEKINDSVGVFRINKTDKDKYFESGMVIVVQPLRKYTPAEITDRKGKLHDAQASYNDQIRQNRDTIPCYRLKPVNIAENGIEAITLAYCLEEHNTAESSKEIP
jgi:hypothetical protein